MRLCLIGRSRFGTEALNLRISDRDPVTRERIDTHLDRYGHLFRAFVLKRRLLRSQIWSRIHILQGVAQTQKHHLSRQKLFGMKKQLMIKVRSMRDEMMMTIAKNDPSKINSAFIISNFSQDYFKEMIDEYVGKVLVCGKAPSDSSQQLVEQQAKQLYKIFFFGEQRTPLERELEVAYLSAKQFKSIRSEKLKVRKDHLAEEVVWTEKDQRILEEKKNWMPSDPNLTDLNFRTYFQSLQLSARKENYLRCQKLMREWTLVDELRFRWTEGKYYNPTSSKYFDWLQEKILVRVLNHLKSTEFTANLNVPHDYMIQAQMMQIHIWMITDRLRKINTLESNTLAKRLTFLLNMQAVRSAQSLNVKKSNLLTTTLQRMLEVNSNILELHFNRSQLTSQNPYKGIDAMVWSIAFAEKVPRYADEIYLFAQYLVRNIEHMQRHSQADIFNGLIEFDPYLVEPDYRARIEQVNPPLSARQFQRQFNSNAKDKDYYYSKVQKQIDEQMIMTHQQKVDTSFSLSQFLQPLRNLRAKYTSLGSYDHYDSMQQQKKKQEQEDKKNTWKSQKDELKKVQSEFENIQKIKNERRREREDK